MTAPRFTVLGGRGFIGSHLARHIRQLGYHCDTPERGSDLRGRPLGHVIFCIGVTGDFRSRPCDTVDAHVGALADLLRAGQFDSLVYLSSTRVYKRHVDARAREADELRVDPLAPDDIYGLSKMTGESLALTGPGRVHVVRLSNVYGEAFDQPGILSALLKEAVTEHRVTLHTSPDSSRDFIAIDDVVNLLTRIALAGTERVYNVASGVNLTNGEVASAIAAATGCQVTAQAGAETVIFPQIDVERIRREFAFTPANLLADLPRLVPACAQYWRDRGFN